MLMYLAVGLLLAVPGSRAGRSRDGKDYSYRKCDNASQTCGSTNPNNNVIDLTEPDRPGPFHDLTTLEIRQLRKFMELDPNIRLSKQESATLSSSFIFTADILLPPKKAVLKYLDKPGETQPIRKARAVVLRGDKQPPVVEEYVCSPLPNIEKCELLPFSSRRNPVPFNFRPVTLVEFITIFDHILAQVDRQIGYILQESYGATFTTCQNECLTATGPPVGSGIIQDEFKRLRWISAAYNRNTGYLHVIDFAVLIEGSSPNPAQWSIVKIWYSNKLFDSFESLIDQYNNNKINKTRLTPPPSDDELYSSLKRRGEYQPPNPQRPPTIVEPDGKRYSIKGRKVEYLGWSFNFRSSNLIGPAVYDVRFKGKRVVYEMALSEIAVFYSAYSPAAQTANFVDSNSILETWFSSLVPGTDCPDSATMVDSVYVSARRSEPQPYKATVCIFEHNNGYPLRRHLASNFGTGSFYGGLADFVLVLRSILTIGNYDYVVDYMFHQNGVIETRLLNTGYIQSVFYTNLERPYGFRIEENLLGHVHFHAVHFKVDMDVGGTCNRYERLNITEEEVNLTAFPDIQYSQTRFTRNLKRTEQEAIYDPNPHEPVYHLVHNAAEKTDKGEIKAYRIKMDSPTKNLIKKGRGNEPSVSWARHQLVVTKQKDEEISSSSLYGTYDSIRPVVDFSSFYADNETIVDEDLVFWITTGLHHIPHTEDIPLTTTAGHDLTFSLLPFNYFPECPSMGSRDAIFIEHIDPENPQRGVKVERYGNSRDQCLIPKPTLEEEVARDPERIL